ncbi:hypothetical protein H0W26_02495, partial [Candidatus Dependentiae bacterium]|nr:hypothetical protein [Candidatus Dependentiae bacterium]
MIKLLHHVLLLAAVLQFFSYCSAEPRILENIIKSVTIDKNSLKVSINDSFKEEWLQDDFFVEYESDIDLEKIPYSIALLPFTLTIYAIVWVSGKDYSIDC